MRVRNNKGNVFVGNLPLAFSDERLAETFDPYGIVLIAAVARDPETGARLRYGFVDIATEKAATLAITALDGSEVDGCKLNVKMSERKAKNGAKKPGATPGRRPPFRAAPPRRTPVGGAAETPVRRDPAGIAERIARPTPNGATDTPERPSQSSVIAAELSEMEPPPRRDFEVAYKPARRKTTPNFQVERRSLPRRS